jgi:lipopolysaccharide transport system ATP-binding protein
MRAPVIHVEDVHKCYRLGVIGRQLVTEEFAALWNRIRGRRNGGVRPPAESVDQQTGDRFWALRGVSFSLGEGDILGIVGRNGAGKSTLLKLLSRISLPTKGRIKMRGRISSLLEVGTGFHPELTGRENIYLNGAIHGMRRSVISARLDEIIAFSGIEHHIDTPIKRYSSGMKVRLGFAVAAHLDPEILIVDEVLAVGDAEFQRKCVGSLRQVADSGRTILFVSHNMTPVRSLCSRILWMERGMVRQDGPTEAVIGEYLRHYLPSVQEQRWENGEAPGTEEFQLLSVQAVSAREDGAYYISDPVRIEIEIFNKGITDDDLNIRLGVKTDSDVVAFISDMEASVGERRIWKNGRSKVSCVIPGDLLNDGGYRISLIFFRRNTKVLVVRDAIHIEIQEGARQGTWFNQWHGVVRPRTAWIR